MSWKKHIFQIKILISLASRVTWTLPSTSTTHSLPQCALCLINISHEMLNVLSFNHPTSLFSYLLVKMILWGFTEPGSSHAFFNEFWWNENAQIATVCRVVVEVIVQEVKVFFLGPSIHDVTINWEGGVPKLGVVFYGRPLSLFLLQVLQKNIGLFSFLSQLAHFGTPLHPKIEFEEN